MKEYLTSLLTSVILEKVNDNKWPHLVTFSRAHTLDGGGGGAPNFFSKNFSKTISAPTAKSAIRTDCAEKSVLLHENGWDILHYRLFNQIYAVFICLWIIQKWTFLDSVFGMISVIHTVVRICSSNIPDKSQPKAIRSITSYQVIRSIPAIWCAHVGMSASSRHYFDISTFSDTHISERV